MSLSGGTKATVLETSFGTFAGSDQDGARTFLGIKYAQVKNWLAAPELITSYGNKVVDATQYGPRAPAPDLCTFEQSTLIQCTIGAAPETLMSHSECLNLNITVPSLHTGAAAVLPVMVFIHGGGLIMGANSWPQWDPARLIKMSADIGMPMIVVSVNYRLGAPGNLTSDELRSAGYLGNNSLRDQRCALEWVQKFIGGFGGDEENVTVFGASAGAASVLHHLGCKEPLFRRAISMSGTPIMLKPLSPAVAETSYNAVLQALGLEYASTHDRIQKLLAMSPEDLVQKIPITIPISPYLDGDIIPEAPSFAYLSSGTLQSLNNTWCEELLVGSCAHDGNVFYFMGLSSRLPGIASTIHTSFSRNLSASVAGAILSAYDITPSTPDEEAMASIIELGTDIAYGLPASYYARAFRGRVASYLFTESNPWDGMFKGKSVHLLDAVFLFQNFNKHIPDKAKMTARKIAEDFVAFAYGKAGSLWADGRTKVYGLDSGKIGGLETLVQQANVDLDEVSAAWDLFVAGK
ncbi:carboxylesteras-like protein [Alternaria rosae]|uniref:carboxylesterase-like protein n=1 Tax=Alternaria rosae TaxID=1187941 RepID=UPI001E8EA091|nr:carboxylesterase-like protein [Alternaria rosae]KAH6873311.1 carboxylesteras-like protein [Alternaria rosae]